jgi:hypothetical protein
MNLIGEKSLRKLALLFMQKTSYFIELVYVKVKRRQRKLNVSSVRIGCLMPNIFDNINCFLKIWNLSRSIRFTDKITEVLMKSSYVFVYDLPQVEFHDQKEGWFTLSDDINKSTGYTKIVYFSRNFMREIKPGLSKSKSFLCSRYKQNWQTEH